jgi:hypothetical protein
MPRRVTMEAEEKRKRKIPELFADSKAFKITALVFACLLAVGITVGGYFVVKDVFFEEEIPALPIYRTPSLRSSNETGQMWLVTCAPGRITPGQTCTLRANFLNAGPKVGDELWFLVKTPSGKKYGTKVDEVGSPQGSNPSPDFNMYYSIEWPRRLNSGTTSEKGLYQVFFVDTDPASSGRYPSTLNGNGCGEFTVAAQQKNTPSPAGMLKVDTWKSEGRQWPFYLRTGDIYYNDLSKPRAGAFEYVDDNHIRFVIFQDYEEDNWDPDNPATYPWMTSQVTYIDVNHVQLSYAGLMNSGPMTFSRMQ